jgi:hypothetical protein
MFSSSILRMGIQKRFLSLNIRNYVHYKIYMLLAIIILFSFLYLLLDDTHFSGLNTIHELIKNEVIKAKIETQISKQGHTKSNANITDSQQVGTNNSFANIETFTSKEAMQFYEKEDKQNKAIDKATKHAEKEVSSQELTLDKIKPPLWQKYFNRLYFAVSSGCLLGYGDVYPISNIAKFFTMIQALITVTLIVY